MGKCSWPATGGGTLDIWEHFIPACELAFPPKPIEDQTCNAVAMVTQHAANAYDWQDVLALNKESVALGKTILHTDFDASSPNFELWVSWEHDNDNVGADIGWTGGINVYQNDDIQSLHPITTGVPVLDGGAVADKLILTHITTAIIQTTVLVTGPFYAAPWIYRVSDDNEGVALVHGLYFKYRLS